MVSSLKKIIRFPGRGSPTDEQLIEQIKAGDQQAWAAFLARYSDLLYGKAQEYSRSSGAWLAAEEREDEVAELYLFMAQQLQRSLRSFRGDCAAATWVHAVVGQRKAVLNGYLRQKDRQRSDTRLPQIMLDRPPLEQEIFKRMVWGLTPADIAVELDVAEAACVAVEELVARESPQVYQRLLENRAKRQPALRLDRGGDAPATEQLAAAEPAPDQVVEGRRLAAAVQQGVRTAFAAMTAPQRRVLLLLYNYGASAEEIISLAADGSLGQKVNLNRVYYLKDKGLEAVLGAVVKELEKEGFRALKQQEKRRVLLSRVEALLLELGLPEQRIGGEDSNTAPLETPNK